MIQYSNIGSVERTIRYLFGGMLLIGILQFVVPPMAAFIAAYAVFTAIFAWEPFYSLLSQAKVLFGRVATQAGTGREPVHSST